MRLHTAAALVAVSLVLPASAKDVYLPAAGSISVFRTDTRIFNPSQTKDIQVQAWFLPNGNVDNSAVQPVTITVPKRQMAVYNDVVASLFHSSGLGGVRFSSADDFVATQRVYATSSTACSGAVNPCTLGQFLTGVDGTSAKANGVVIQLSSGTAFRTNLGALNPNPTAANTTWRVYDRTNTVVGTPKTIVMPPWSVMGPLNMLGFSDGIPSNADLSDAWVGYTSDRPIVAYGSVVDNGSTDQTYVPATGDSDPPTPAPSTSAKTFDVALRTSQIVVTPPDMGGMRVGDQVAFHVHAVDPGHGFKLVDGDGNVLIDDRSPAGGFAVGAAFDQTITINGEGTYLFFCTHPTCSSGHTSMVGSFTVGNPTDPGTKY